MRAGVETLAVIERDGLLMHEKTSEKSRVLLLAYS
jgi:hypothetical protein